MKKRLFVLVCALVLLVGCMALSAMAADNKSGYCEACKQTVTWEPIVYGAVTNGVHKHYYVTASGTGTQVVAEAGDKVCIDLNGKTVEFKTNRAFLAYQATADAPATMSIQDSVGGAVINCLSKKGATNNGAGGVMWVDNYCTLNVYGGTYNLVSDPGNARTSVGGVVSVYPGATLNIYGGTFNGGELGYSATKRGGNIDVQGTGVLNISGGIFTSGSGATYGDCINLRSGAIMSISGNPQIDEIFMEALSASMLEVKGAFTGKANLAYKSGLTVEVGTQVGTAASGASIANADLYCTNGSGYAVAIDGTALKLAAPSAEEVRHACEHCGQIVKWAVFPNTSVTTAGTYHYYLDKDYDTKTAKQFSVKGGAKVCLDLMGHSYQSAGRALATSESGTVLSVMDSVGGGVVGGNGGNNNPGGGSVHVGGSSIFNLYSGTLNFTHDASTATTYGGVGRGGVISNSGTVNIYGGKIEGGEVVACTYPFSGIIGAGGAIYNGGTLNVLGGEITSGKAPATGAGPCIYNPSGYTISLGGDAKIEEIYFAANNAAKLIVNDDFTGNVQLTYAPSIALSQSLAVGTCTATDWQGTITCSSAKFPSALPKDGQLVLSAYPAGTVAGTAGQGYPSLQEAVDAAAEGALVELVASAKGDVNVTKNVTLQLAGCSIDGTVTVAEGKTLSVMDNQTDDYSVADGKYGKIKAVSGNVTGYQTGSNTYVKVTESTGVSFHCVTLQIYAMTLRTDADDQPGIFYKSHFKADEKAAAVIDTFGVALNVNEVPSAVNMNTSTKCTYFTNFESGPDGNIGNTTSTLVKGILKTKNSDATNTRNMNREIFGRAYAKTTDGQLLFGQHVSRSLATQLQAVDRMVDGLSSVQTQTVTNLYAQFKTVLSALNLTNIAAATESNEAGMLKVLVLGNSHGLDATNLLAEVFYQEREAGNHDRDVLIAALYYGGCKVSQHHTFLKNNQQEYTYHKNYATKSGEAWVVKDATCLDALQDEQWDIILMQQMNTNAGKEGDYKASDWKFVADYLLEHQDQKPILGFHMTWANPDDYELFLNDDAPYNIRYISTYSDPTSWRTNHEKLFNLGDGKYEMNVMYDEIMRLTQKYIIDSTEWLGEDYFDETYIMNSATPIQYLQNVLGREQLNVYRDYTHVSDYGRLTVAYQWYAQLMGLEALTEVNTDVIPKSLKHKNSKYPTATDANGDYVVDDDMKADLLEAVNWALKNPWNLPTE